MKTSLREPLLTFAAATAIAAGLFWLGHAVPFVHRNLTAAIAVLFFYAPVGAGWVTGRPFDFREAGLTLGAWRMGAATLGLAIAATFPLFVGGFFAFYDVTCASGAGALARLCPGGWLGWSGGHLHLPDGFALGAANQILVVAIPEEVFFRGYLLQRLEERWPARRRLLGAPIGQALVASSVLFALGHLLVDLNPQRLAVFFPALVFGWMRARTRSLVPGALFHAGCNLLAQVLHASYFAG